MVVMRAFATRGTGVMHERYGLPADMHRASAALADAATVFGAVEIEYVPKYPEKWRVCRDIGGSRPPIHSELDRHNLSSNNTPVKRVSRPIE